MVKIFFRLLNGSKIQAQVSCKREAQGDFIKRKSQSEAGERAWRYVAGEEDGGMEEMQQ